MKICLSIFLSGSFIASASALDLASYLKSYMNQSQELKISTVQMEQEENLYHAADWFSQLESNLSLYRQERRYDFPGSLNYELDSNIAQASLTQSYFSGTQVTAEGSFDYSKHSEYDKNQRNYSYSLMLSQSLYKNSFGSLNRKQLARQISLKNRSSLAHRQAQLEACAQGIEEYLIAYSAQEKIALLEETEKNAEKVWNFAQDAYKRKLINELSFLSAEADYRDKQMRMEESHTELWSVKRKLADRVGKLAYSFLSDPSALFDQMKVLSFSQNDNIKMKQMEEELKEKKWQYLALQDQNRSQIDLVLKAGKSVTQNDYSFSVAGDNSNNFVLIGVNASLPLWKSGDRAALQNALLDSKLTEVKKEQLAQQLVQESEQLERKLALLNEQRDTLQKKVKILDRQVTLAYQSLMRAKIELVDYLRYRDSYLEEKMHLPEVSKSAYLTHLELIKLQSALPEICGGQSGVLGGKL